METLCVDDRVVAALRALPSLVAVHRVVAAADGGDAGVGVDLRQAGLEVVHEPESGARGRVTAIEERVDLHGRHAEACRQLHERDEVAIMGMDAAGPDEADGVQATGLLRALTGGEERGAGVERAVVDGGVDAGQVLEHGAAGAQVEVAHLGVAHLARGQADGVLRCTQGRVRPRGQRRSPARHRRGGDGVLRRVRSDAEPVEDDEDDGPRPGPPRHEARPRACAVIPARAAMPAISSGLSEAPPMSAPSTPGSARNSPMFAEVTLPP